MVQSENKETLRCVFFLKDKYVLSVPNNSGQFVSKIIRLARCKCSLRAFCNGRRVCLSVCLSRVRSRKLSDIGAKFRHLCRKLGSPSKNMTLDFAPEVDKYPKSSLKLQNSPKWGECEPVASLR